MNEEEHVSAHRRSKIISYVVGVMLVLGLIAFVLISPRLSTTSTISDQDRLLLDEIRQLKVDGQLVTIELVDQRARIVLLEAWDELQRKTTGEPANGPVTTQTVTVYVDGEGKRIEVNGEAVELDGVEDTAANANERILRRVLALKEQYLVSTP